MNIEFRSLPPNGCKIILRGDGCKKHVAYLNQLNGVINEDNNVINLSDAAQADDWLHQILSKNHHNVIHLNMQQYQFTNDRYVILGEDLNKNTTLKKFSVMLSEHQAAESAPLFDGIANNTSIQQLKISLERSRSHEWKLLGQALTRNKAITNLYLDQCRTQLLPVAGDENAAVELFKCLASNDVLTAMHSSAFNYSPQEMIALGEGLKQNNYLKSLSIASNFRYIRECDIGPLGEALKHNYALEDIQLRNMIFTKDHLSRLVDGLTINKTLTSLCWEVTLNCEPDALITYLQTTQTLRKLDMKICNRAEENSLALCTALASNKSLTNLALRFSPLINANVGSIIQNNKNIKKLYLNGKLTEETAQIITKLLSTNNTLTSFEIVLGISGTTLPFNQILKCNTSLRSLTASLFSQDDFIELISTNNSLKTLVARVVKGQDENFIESLTKAVENNFALTKIQIELLSVHFEDICDRNFALQKQRYEDTAIILHIIARSDLCSKLPIELWTAIFSDINYPGLESFEPLAKSILSLYRNNAK